MNVIFKSIEINNFLSLGKDIKVDLDDRGFVLVNGINLESEKSKSNGSGKSSIFDAIFWTITGETTRGASEVVNEKSKEGCFCKLELSVDESSYIIERYKSHKECGNSVRFFENDELISDQTKKSQEMINRLIPTMSTEILGSIVLLGQGLPYKFSSLSPIRRKELLETMSGSSSQIEKFKYQLDLVESEFVREDSEVKSRINKINSEMMSNQRLIDYINESRKVSTEEILDQIKTLESQTEIRNKSIVDLKKSYEVEGERLSQIKTIYDNLNLYIQEVKVNFNQLVNEINQIGTGVCPTCNRPYDDYEELQIKLKEKCNQKSDLETTLNNLNAKLAGVKSQLNAQTSKSDEILNQIRSQEYEAQTQSQRIVSLKESLKENKDTDEKLKKAEEDLKVKNVELFDENKVQEKVTEKISTISFIKRQLSRDFKGYVLSEVIEYLSNRAESYGNYLFDSHKIKIKLSGNKILVYIDDRLYDNLSGGERQRVDLCVQFALRDMLITTTGFSCNLLVLDEVFDNLDYQGSENLITLITSEFSDVNSVFTVTHHTDISVPYDTVITVTKDTDGISKVSENE